MDSPPPNPPSLRLRPLPATGLGRAALGLLLGGALLTVGLLVQAGGAKIGPANRPVEEPAADYVTSETCRSCHPGNYASWHASFHRTMTQAAEPANFAAPMDGLELSHGDRDYRVALQDGKYLVRSKPAGAAASAYGPPKAIVLLTGSHHLQVLWTETGDSRTLDQFPFAYVIAEKQWAPMEQTFLTAPGPQQLYDKGYWNNGCITCHTTNARSRPGPGGRYDSKASEFGISCEACHSGGREHIAANRNPLRRLAQQWSEKPDPTIANPARMDGPTSTLACGQCHSISAFRDAAKTQAMARDGTQFRPGMKEIPERWIAQPHGRDHPAERAALLQENPHFFGDSFWPDGMIRVTGREANGTMASPCFQGGKFSCLSCHDLHPEKTDPASLATWKTEHQMKPGLVGSDQACLQCHQKFQLRLAAHTHHAAESEGSRCANCHMPHTTYGLLRALRSHQISSPTAHETVESGRPNACNLCHLDQPLAWTAGKLNEWYSQAVPRLEADDRDLALGAKLILQGDAGQRALIAWAMGWAPAQKASGAEWLYPFLTFELNDPYAAVRFAAWKSLQTLPGFSGYAFNYTSGDATQKEALSTAYRKWWFEVRKESTPHRAPTLLLPNGMFRQEIFDRLLDRRDNRKLLLAE